MQLPRMIISGWMLISFTSWVVVSETSHYHKNTAHTSICGENLKRVEGNFSSISCCGACLLQNGHGYSYTDGKCKIARSPGSDVSQLGIKTAIYKKMSYKISNINIALKKPTKATSPHYHPGDRNSEYAVDGIDLGVNSTPMSYYHSQAHTPNPWWMVDLEDIFLIGEIQILPYGNGHFYHFTRIEIRVGLKEPSEEGNFSAWEMFGFYEGPASSDGLFIKFAANNRTCGRYVSIKKLDATILVLSEVKVYALIED